MNPGTSFATKLLLAILALGTTGALGYLGYQNYQIKQAKTLVEIELAQTRQDFASTTQGLMVNIDVLKQLLTTTQSDKTNAEQDILKQKEVLNTMNAQVEFMSSSLGRYNKLAKIDREILEKYSRVYFLNENYIPKYLTIIPPLYTLGIKREISTDVWPFLQQLLDAATAQNIDLKIASAYRSFETQSKLKSAYTVTYGSGANKFSADQGYSEHQLGTTVDFTTSKLASNFSGFEKTASYLWLVDNAYKYGFILSYPKKNAYYIFEPWHWRFVGKSLALKLHIENKNFYDISQSDLNEYLVSIFDQQ